MNNNSMLAKLAQMFDTFLSTETMTTATCFIRYTAWECAAKLPGILLEDSFAGLIKATTTIAYLIHLDLPKENSYINTTTCLEVATTTWASHAHSLLVNNCKMLAALEHSKSIAKVTTVEDNLNALLDQMEPLAARFLRTLLSQQFTFQCKLHSTYKTDLVLPHCSNWLSLDANSLRDTKQGQNKTMTRNIDHWTERIIRELFKARPTYSESTDDCIVLIHDELFQIYWRRTLPIKLAGKNTAVIFPHVSLAESPLGVLDTSPDEEDDNEDSASDYSSFE